ncbi:hypothetical protein AUR64_18880 [Haloprofundus marisrubri]|uniref:Uncharacterized protein n=1 Tax=Haloprofundus marisrubri TaxID=1514971 RepID=A0A0W1R4D5_9EURY|nr:hypothetical protein [Haloprofundus marisrubri]KTG08305.1 hypothetical protein AUR64_18880 [Haloprofundus marisrubri]
MEIRGRRECADCGTRWSYYETGSVSCPDCGSIRSVGVDERKEHTDTATTLELTDLKTTLVDGEVRDVVDDLKPRLREYIRKRGFVSEGELRPLDDEILVAAELLHAVDVYDRSRETTEEEYLYVLTLVNGAESGDRPAPDDVPRSMAAARGLAYATVVSKYRREAVTWLEANPDAEAQTTLGTIRDHEKRMHALEGDVPLTDSERLVEATKELSEYLATDELDALATAQDRLSRLG